MADEVAQALQEIATLLRRRVEQEDANQARTIQWHEESLARLTDIKTRTPDVGDDDLRLHRERIQSMVDEQARKTEQRVEEQRRELDEERELKREILGEFKRQNTLLEQILAKLS